MMLRTSAWAATWDPGWCCQRPGSILQRGHVSSSLALRGLLVATAGQVQGCSQPSSPSRRGLGLAHACPSPIQICCRCAVHSGLPSFLYSGRERTAPWCRCHSLRKLPLSYWFAVSRIAGSKIFSPFWCISRGSFLVLHTLMLKALSLILTDAFETDLLEFCYNFRQSLGLRSQQPTWHQLPATFIVRQLNLEFISHVGCRVVGERIRCRHL